MKELIKKLPFARTLNRKVKGHFSERSKLLRALPRNAVGAEIGVHLGYFSEKIIEVSEPVKLYLIDPWKYESGDDYEQAWYGGASEGENELDQRYESVKTRFSGNISNGQVEVIRKSSAEALIGLEDASLDFVYIDGNHLYDYVKQDLELSFQKVKAGGLITGDDYGPGGWWDGGVQIAVDEFCANYPVTTVWIRGSQFILRKTAE